MTMVLMADVTGKESYKTLAENFMNMILSLPTTPKGLVWTSNSQWGSLRYDSYLSCKLCRPDVFSKTYKKFKFFVVDLTRLKSL